RLRCRTERLVVVRQPHSRSERVERAEADSRTSTLAECWASVALRSRSVSLERWQAEIGREIEQLARAPYFVQEPDALIGVRDELRRIRAGRGTDHELEEDDGVWAIVDNAWRLAAKLSEARRRLDERECAELELFAAERLVEASLRYR